MPEQKSIVKDSLGGNKHLNQSKRPVRVPIHKQAALAADAREGYKRYWVNETRGRVEQFLLAGWSVVTEEANLSDNRAQTESQLGSVVRKVVNKGPKADSQTAVLMEIPLELYNLDQMDQQKENDRVESQYNPTNVRNTTGMDYGSMTIDDKRKK